MSSEAGLAHPNPDTEKWKDKVVPYPCDLCEESADFLMLQAQLTNVSLSVPFVSRSLALKELTGSSLRRVLAFPQMHIRGKKMGVDWMQMLRNRQISEGRRPASWRWKDCRVRMGQVFPADTRGECEQSQPMMVERVGVGRVHTIVPEYLFLGVFAVASGVASRAVLPQGRNHLPHAACSKSGSAPT